MPDFTWGKNAEAIYAKAISATPFPFRGNTRDGLNKLLMAEFGESKTISEADIVRIIKKNTPAAFLGRGMKAIAPLLSDPSLAEY